MGAETGIQWTDATWNPVRGCSRISPGCEHCYAETMAGRFSGPGRPFHGFALQSPARWTRKVALAPEMLDLPLRWKKPRRIFVNSMSDLFHEELSNEAIAAVFGVMAAAPQHRFQVLTKRAERMREWFIWAEKRGEQGASLFHDDPLDWRIRQMCHVAARLAGADMNPDARQNHGGPWPLPNAWVGISVEDQARANERIPHLLATPAAVRFLSCEPLLGEVSFRWAKWAPMGRGHDTGHLDGLRGIDWVIVGGESGPGARPMQLEWARSIVAQCKAGGVPVFVKQLGAYTMGSGADVTAVLTAQGRATTGAYPPGPWRLPIKSPNGGDMAEWPADMQVREFPEVSRG